MAQCLFGMLSRAPAGGPYGTFATGYRSEPVSEWPGRHAVEPCFQSVIDDVWAGRRPHALVPSSDGTLLHYLKHFPAGVPCDGRFYGFTVRTVRIARRRRRSRLALVAVLGVVVGLSVS